MRSTMRFLILIIVVAFLIMSCAHIPVSDVSQSELAKAKAFWNCSQYCLESFNTYTSLAQRNDRMAQFYLGCHYRIGKGTNIDYKESAKWFLMAAKAGHHVAMFNLAWQYQYGEGVEVNYRKAAYWYTRSAELGWHNAQRELGSMYFIGQGVPKNRTKALMWLELAIAQNAEEAQMRYDKLLPLASKREIVKSHRAARKWQMAHKDLVIPPWY